MSPGGVDRDILRRHLLALDSALKNLRRHAGRPLEALTDDTDEAWAVERGLLLCIQNALDIASHLAAGTGHDVPNYTSAIDLMATLGIMPAEFVARFRGAAGFRNVVVHAYLDVDLTIVHSLINERLSEFEEFARYIQQYLDGSDS